MDNNYFGLDSLYKQIFGKGFVAPCDISKDDNICVIFSGVVEHNGQKIYINPEDKRKFIQIEDKNEKIKWGGFVDRQDD